MKLREDLTINELLCITELIHKLKPTLIDYTCVGIEIPQINDRNVIFHMASSDDKQTIMITADYFV